MKPFPFLVFGFLESTTVPLVPSVAVSFAAFEGRNIFISGGQKLQMFSITHQVGLIFQLLDNLFYQTIASFRFFSFVFQSCHQVLIGFCL